MTPTHPISGGGASCKLCLGHGKLLSMRSWFLADGFYVSQSCWHCGGTGLAKGNPEMIREYRQREFRAGQAALGKLGAKATDEEKAEAVRAAFTAA